MAEGFFERLKKRAESLDSVLCIGLDPRISEGTTKDKIRSAILEQNKGLIDATRTFALSYKPNIAFYEAWGEEGLDALRETLRYIGKEIPVILDAKRGDIGATAEAYAMMAFDEFSCDALTVSPYMGADSVEPFSRREGKGVFVLCKTSNPGANDLQLLNVGSGVETLYQRVADKVSLWGKSYGLVVAGNDAFALETIRKRHPNIWFLAPGIGAQGGTITEAVQAGLSADGWGILPVVARSIAQAENPQKEAEKLVEEFRSTRNDVLKSRKSSSTSSLTVLSRTAILQEDLKQRVLRGLIRNGCFKTGEFKLKSGEISPFYVDLRRVMSDTVLLREVGLAYASLLGPGTPLEGHRFDRIAGIPVAGLPLAASAALATGIPMIFPRMQAKAHGTGNMVEGECAKGENILLLDDLITTGKSKLEACDILRGADLKVEHLVVLLERGTQGRKDMENAGITLHSFAHISEFLPLCQDMGILTLEERRRLEAYALS